MTWSLLELPPELIAHVLRYLTAAELTAFGLSSKQCCELANLESLWQRRCLEDFKFENLDGWNLSYKDFYAKVLCKFGDILGNWQPEIGHYGGLIRIQHGKGCIEGHECLPPVNPYVTEPLRIHKLFSIGMNDDRSGIETVCLKGFHGQHKASVKWKDEKQFLVFHCVESDNHKHPDGKQKEFEDWLTEETGRAPDDFFVHGQELLLMKFLVTTQLGCNYQMSRVPAALSSPWAVIPPGLFKGNYGGHGIEIIQLSYCEDDKKAEGRKITGDPNVPAGQVSLHIDLSRPMILSIDQQSNIALMEEIDIPEVPPDVSLQELPPQPFRVPSDCYERYHNSSLQTCRARFHSKGQVAGHGFSNPYLINAHCIIFDDDNFAFLWLELRSLSMYSRVKEFTDL